MVVWVEINLENKIPAKLFLNVLECTAKMYILLLLGGFVW